jgi:hypothetical protein
VSEKFTRFVLAGIARLVRYWLSTNLIFGMYFAYINYPFRGIRPLAGEMTTTKSRKIPGQIIGDFV